MSSTPTTPGARTFRVPEGLIVPVGSPEAVTTAVASLCDHGLDAAALIRPDRAVLDVATRFAEANHRLDRRLRAGRAALFVATNLDPASRRRQVAQARRAHLPATALVLDDPDAPGDARLAAATDDVLLAEGFDRVHRPRPGDVIALLRADGDWTRVPGPFVIVGDVHNCLDTLADLLGDLGFDDDLTHPTGLFPILAGDVVNKGGRHPGDPGVAPRDYDAARTLRWALAQRARGALGWVAGNHEEALVRALTGAGLSEGPSTATVAALAAQPDGDALARAFVATALSLPSVVDLLDGEGRVLHVVHAGYRDDLRDGSTERLRRVALHGREPSLDRLAPGHGVLYGHTPQRAARVRRQPNGSLAVGLETGAWRGGLLSAWRTDTSSIVTRPPRERDARERPVRAVAGSVPVPA